MINISVIIPNLNGGKYLPNCLSHLLTAIDNTPNSKFEIILADNASTDNSLDIFRNISTKYNSKAIINIINRGFAESVNLGIKASKYQYVCLLNNDLNLDKNWFKLITDVISTNTGNKIATFCGTILNNLGTTYESQGLKFDYRGRCQNINNGKAFFPKDLSTSDKPALIWGASAAAVIYKKSIIEKIGLFDQTFFAYEEDVDLALRLHKLGFGTLYIPGAISYHLGGGTSKLMGNFRSINDAKNWIYIIIKNYTLDEIIHNIFPIIEERLRNLSGLIKITISIFKFKSLYLLPLSLFKTYFPVIIYLPDMLKKRRQFQNLLKSIR